MIVRSILAATFSVAALCVCVPGIFAQSISASTTTTTVSATSTAAANVPVTTTTISQSTPVDVTSDDALFGATAKDTVADPSQKVDISNLNTTTQPIFHGNYELFGIGTWGWTNYPDLHDPLGGEFESYYALAMNALVKLDLRPDPSVRIGATLRTSFPDGVPDYISNPGDLPSNQPLPYTPLGTAWDEIGLSVDELFVDYTLAQSAFFRFGKYGITWGQGKIFNPGNLMLNSQNGFAFKAFVPVLSNGFTAVVLGEPNYFSNSKVSEAKELGYAGLFEQSVGPFAVGLSGLYQPAQGTSVDMYVRTSLQGFDLYGETVASFPEPEAPTWNVLGGFYWEGLTPKLQITGEYWYNSATPGGRDHRIGVGVSLETIPGLGLQPKLLWYHSFMDGSGQVAVGFGFNIGPHLVVTIAPSYSYGKQDGIYVTGANSSNSDPAPGKRRIFLLIKLDLTGDL